MEFKGKKILLIAPVFFGYEKAIKQKLNELGGHVDFLPDRPFDNVFLKALMRLSRSLFIPVSNTYYTSKFRERCSHNYDYVFVINGEGLSRKSVSKLKQFNPNAKLIFYTWDSVKNKPHLIELFNLFDASFSFDAQDAMYYGVRYRPLFYINKNDLIQPGPIYDICFVGTAHQDRFQIVKLLANKYPKLKIYTYLYLQAKWVYVIYWIFNKSFKGAKLKDFRFVPLNKNNLDQVIKNSKAVLDIQHPNQSGLTMRTIETLANKKKLLTTNPSIKQSDLYDPINVAVIDRELTHKIREDFWVKPFKDWPEDLYFRYSLDGWLIEIFDFSKDKLQEN